MATRVEQDVQLVAEEAQVVQVLAQAVQVETVARKLPSGQVV